jgi:hypothetical protein
MTSKDLPKRQLSKSKFSMYLRTKCDRELYLSLFSNNPDNLKAAGLPVPLKVRPGVQLITASGREFEGEQYDLLIASIPSFVVHKSNGRAPVELKDALSSVTDRALILQPAIEPETFRDFALGQLGLTEEAQALIPELSGLRPDVLFVSEPGSATYEVLPDGSRQRVAADDPRRPIATIDLKNITEANASYSAEVCLYAYFIAAWLAMQDKELRENYFVSDQVFLWRHVEMPNFAKILTAVEGGDHNKRLDALLEDLQDGRVNFLVYMPSVRKFFVEDVPRVLGIGDEEGWDALEYHVNPRCSSCDWLGNKSWLPPDEQKVFDEHPEHYCFMNAEIRDHLSKMPTLSKGAAKVLQGEGHPRIADLVGIEPSAAPLKRHTILKKDRKQISDRAQALVENVASVDNETRIGGLARSWNAEYDVVVNFDAGAGLLTGIGLRGVLSAPFGESFAQADQAPKHFQFLGDNAYVVPRDNAPAEWSALVGFIEQLAEWVKKTEEIFAEREWGRVQTQICFWDARQYEELCNAFSRHLIDILTLPEKSQRAVAWVFPAENLMERENQICPSIVFIKDVINSSVRLPQRFATTLPGTAEHYHHPNLEPREIDNYYREPLGDAIPRERIFDIWKSPTGTVRMFGKTVSIADAIQRYGSVLQIHAWALGSITARLRSDLGDALRGRAPTLPLSVPQGMNSVAQDSKLWNQWSEVSNATSETAALLGFTTRAEWLEASYKAIILETVVEDHGGHTYTFEVSAESTEAKIEEGDAFCTVGIVDWPGFPLETPNSLGLGIEPENQGSYFAPMHKIVAAKVEKFDRANRRARISFRPRSPYFAEVFNALLAEGTIPFGTEQIYLLEALPYNDSATTKKILKEIGHPKCAKTAPQSLLAMGKAVAKKLPSGTDEDTAVARVLWSADELCSNFIRADADAKAIADFAETVNTHALNPSQYDAVLASAKTQLSIIWGPPGTGKTDTLVAFLHAVIREGNQRNILITGPNYRTIEEIAERLANNLEGDVEAACDFYWAYSKYRPAKVPPETSPHLNLKSVNLDPDLADVQEMVQSANNNARTTVIATTAHIVQNIVQFVTGADSVVAEVFDLAVLDESSQIPVTLALRPLSALKHNAQLVIAGDHLQMPPIQALDPPTGAEYLVSSVQNYLIERFGVVSQKLLENYRSNQDLVDYAKTLGYPPMLQAHEPDKKLLMLKDVHEIWAQLPPEMPQTEAYADLLDPDKAVTAFIHEDPISSQANEFEASFVAALAYCLRHSMATELNINKEMSGTPYDDDTFFEKGIGIVTPHKAQKALVVRALIGLFPEADEQKIYDAVDTVERFQGGERQAIIVSFGVGDTDIIEGEEAFLLQMERTNVAVSRAMAKCIILMPASLAYHLPSDQKASDTSVALKSYVEEFCSNRQKVEIAFAGEVREGEVRWH